MSRTNRDGFTLFESLITISLFAMVVAGLLLFFVTLARASIPRTVSGLRIAPSLGALRDAALMNQTFAQRVGESKAVYVFGGSHRSISSSSIEAQVRPLSATTLPTIANFGAGLPPSTWAFNQLYSAQLGTQEASSDASDFTVLVIGPSPAPLGQLQITCMLQVRHTSFTDDGQAWGKYSVTLVDLNETDSYVFAVEADHEAGLTLPVGAIHTWHRYQPGVVAEEGPTVCVLPDPHLMAGKSGISGESEAVSRFVFFLQ